MNVAVAGISGEQEIIGYTEEGCFWVQVPSDEGDGDGFEGRRD